VKESGGGQAMTARELDAFVAVKLSQKQLEILQHSLGVDEYGRGQMFRNHFCAGGVDEDICRELVSIGYMETFTRSWLPYYNCIVTDAGKSAMLEQSPKPPKLTRSQLRYRSYLNADTGKSFRSWLETEGKRAAIEEMEGRLQ
jgi:hypothetical protein